MWLYALTIFLSAFLLFQVQPLIGKYILPWFGSTPGVWTTCMLFFQMLLLAGYAYAHLIVSRLQPRRQAVVHLVLLLGVLLLLPITPSDGWKPAAEDDPVWRILALLAVSVGGPYLLLSSTGPLLQGWFSQTHPGRSPYRLYALSNAGSLLALLSYPFVFEPRLRLGEQTWLWSTGYVVFAVLCGLCAWRLLRSSRSTLLGAEDSSGGRVPAETSQLPASAMRQEVPNQEVAAAPRWSDVVLWISLAACASVMLLAVTQAMCQDVPVNPFLWVAPLSIYLLSFIICFDNPRWYQRRVFVPLLAVVVAVAVPTAIVGADLPVEELAKTEALRVVVLLLFVVPMSVWVVWPGHHRQRWAPRKLLIRTALAALVATPVLTVAMQHYSEPALSRSNLLIMVVIAMMLLLLFALCMSCHGELYRLRPHPRHLTLFYLMIATGGALGGLFNAVVAPLVFDGLWELPLGLVATCGLLLVVYSRDIERVLRTEPPGMRRRNAVALGTLGALGVIVLGFAVAYYVSNARQGDLERARNFYGVLQVQDSWFNLTGNPNEPYYVPVREMVHGRINHGWQFQDDEEDPFAQKRSEWITSYYAPDSGLGVALGNHPTRLAGGTLRIGVIGQGTGSIAAHAQSGDYLRFYEINPEVVRLAEEYFTYCSDAAARGADVDIYLGDARIVMERQAEDDQAQQFDILAVDAFSSDAIPIHLLTRECVDLYWKHLKPDGILAVHISNRHIDLMPVVRKTAELCGKKAVLVDNEGNPADGTTGARWILVTSNREFLDRQPVETARTPWPDWTPPPVLWTDDFHSLWGLLK